MDKEMVKFFNGFRAKPDNKLCYECGAPNPTWASVPLGIIICMSSLLLDRLSSVHSLVGLECAGTHRSLGVHLSFVRSTTLDNWDESQLSQMRVGGNRYDVWHCLNGIELSFSSHESRGELSSFLSVSVCKAFFQQYGVNVADLTERYSTPVACAYRDRIQGRFASTAFVLLYLPLSCFPAFLSLFLFFFLSFSSFLILCHPSFYSPLVLASGGQWKDPSPTELAKQYKGYPVNRPGIMHCDWNRF
jgi:hypothetical protein